MRGKCTNTFEMTLLKIDKRGKTLVFRSKQQNKGALIKRHQKRFSDVIKVCKSQDFPHFTINTYLITC